MLYAHKIGSAHLFMPESNICIQIDFTTWLNCFECSTNINNARNQIQKENGNDENIGDTWARPLKTVQSAIDRTPKYNEGFITI